jgi:hypothetical protein
MFPASLRRLLPRPSAAPRRARKGAPPRLEDRALPSVVNWTNPAGGDWNTPGNWSTGALPGLGDDVVIGTVSGTVTHSSGTHSVHSLSSASPFTLSGGALTLEAYSALNDAFTLSGGTLTSRGELDLNAAFTWSSGTLAGLGFTVASAGITLSSGGGKTLNQQALNNAGTATWTGGNISLSADATWNNLTGATFGIQTTGAFSGGTFNNAGTVQKSAGSGATALNARFNNDGTLDVAFGPLTLGGGGASSGTFTAETGTTLSFGGGLATLSAASTVNGAGSVAFSGGTTTLLGAYTLTGDTTVSGGTPTFNSNVTLPTLTLSGGTLAGAGTVTVSGLLTWTGGTMSGGGRTVANGGIDINGSNPKVLGFRTLDNVGMATWTGTGYLDFSGGAVWNNPTGSVLDIRNDTGFGHVSLTINNAGTIRKSVGTGTTTVNAAINNTGTVAATSGTLRLIGGGLNRATLSATAGSVLELGGGTMVLAAGSTLPDNLSITGATVSLLTDLTVSTLTLSGGTLSGAGALSVTGLFTWTGGTIAGSATVNANGGIAISGANGKSLDNATLNNAGMAIWTGTGGVGFSNLAVWNNRAGSVLDIRNDTVLGGGGATFNNAGTVRKSAGTGTSSLNAALNNTGTVDAASGTLSLNGGGLNTATLSAASGATLQIGGGALALGPGSTLPNALTVAGGTANFLANLTVTTLTLSGGNLGGAGALSVTGLFTWTGGSIVSGGTVNANGGMTISGANDKGLSGTLNNAGMATMTSTGNVVLTDFGVFNNLATGTFTLQSDSAFRTYSVFTTPGTFNNAGLFKKSLSTGFSYMTQTRFNNTGTVEVASGTLDLAGGGVSSGAFLTDAGAVLEFGGGTHYLSAASSISGAGNVVFDTDSFNTMSTTIDGTYNVSGTTTLQWSTPPFFYPYIAFNGPTEMGQLNLATDTISGDGDITVDGLFTWTGGTLGGNGHLLANGGLTISGPNGKALGRALINGGAGVWRDTGSVTFYNGASFDNAATGTFDIQSEVVFGSLGSVFSNEGTLKKSVGSGTVIVSGDYLVNTGTLEVDSGTLNFTGDLLSAGTVDVHSGATLKVDGGYTQWAGTLLLRGGTLTLSTGSGLLDVQDGVVDARGTINGSVLNAGTLYVGGDGTAGSLTITGSFTQAAAGTLALDLGGTTAGIDYDQLHVNGAATLDGTLQVSLIGAYAPAAGDSFAVLVCGSRVGDFAMEALPSGVSAVLSSTGLTLQA